MKRLLIVVTVLLGIVRPVGYACDCKWLSFPEAFREARAVFLGSVSRIIPVNDPWSEKVIVEFEVEKIWKRKTAKVLTMHTYQSSGDCRGYSFEQGGRYLIYAREEKPMTYYPGLARNAMVLTTTICTRNWPPLGLDRTDQFARDYLQNELKHLEAGRIPR